MRPASHLPVALAVAALVGAGVAAFVLPPPPSPLVGEPAASAFLDAWERSRLGTFVVSSTFRRDHPDGAFEAETQVVQRPPERLSIGLGGVEGLLDGHVVRCGTDLAGVFSCFESPATTDFVESLEHEMTNLEPFVSGDRPLYAVERDVGGCFILRLALAYPSPPYGERARFCFDRATGAPLLTEIHRGDTVDRTIAVEVSPEVADNDLELPDNAGSLPEPEG